MENLIKFNINDIADYCPIAVNCNFSKDFHGEGNTPISCDESILERILNQIEKDTERVHILSFKYVDQITPKEKHYNSLLKENLILYMEKKYYTAIKDIAEEKGRQCYLLPDDSVDEKWSIVYFATTDKILNILNNPKWQKRNIIECIHREVFLAFFMDEIQLHHHKYDMTNLKYLESSNVYVNCYINVKSLFSRPDYLHLIIQDMAEVIKNNFYEIYSQKQVCLLGVSNNGIILSKLLAYKMGLEVKGINHIGPKYFLEKSENEKYVVDAFRTKQFILISDVICMGGEYRIVKGIIDIIGAKLLGALGIVKIKNVYRGEKDDKAGSRDKEKRIFALLENINDYEKDGARFEYNVFTEEK